MCPVAGASTRIRSATPLRSICLTLPRTRMSRIPGMAPATTSTTRTTSRRLDIRRSPWSARYSRRASSGVIVRAWTVPGGHHRGRRPRPRRSSAPAAREDRPGVVEGPAVAEGGRRRPAGPRAPRPGPKGPSPAAMRARAATIVVFPTPPLPATIRTLLCLQKALTSMTDRSVVSSRCRTARRGSIEGPRTRQGPLRAMLMKKRAGPLVGPALRDYLSTWGVRPPGA